MFYNFCYPFSSVTCCILSFLPGRSQTSLSPSLTARDKRVEIFGYRLLISIFSLFLGYDVAFDCGSPLIYMHILEFGNSLAISEKTHQNN